MGALRGMGVHYRQSNTTNSCRAAVVLFDDPTDYLTIDLKAEWHVAGVPFEAVHTNVERNEEGPHDEQGMWHHLGECPDV